MLIWLVFSNIVHPWYLPVILRTDVQHDVMEHRGHVKKKKKKKGDKKKKMFITKGLSTAEI